MTIFLRLASVLMVAGAVTPPTFATSNVSTAEVDPAAQNVLSRSDEARALVQVAYRRHPLIFETNHGQTDAQVHFLSRGAGYGLFLTSTETVLAFHRPRNGKAAQVAPPQDTGLPSEQAGHELAFRRTEDAVVYTQVIGGNPCVRFVGDEKLPTKVNYFIGDDAKKWRKNVPTFAKVKCEGVYPGVDLVYYGSQGQLAYDFIVAPEVDYKIINLRFHGIHRLELDERGDLLLHIAGGIVRQKKPITYQESNGLRNHISSHYILKDASSVGFRVGDYDTSRPLIIDPVLTYSTYLGGIGSDEGIGITADEHGAAYVTGLTFSPNFPIKNPLDAQGNFEDAFVTKFDAAGSLVYSTYLGGSRGRSVPSEPEIGRGIAVDREGNAYITGITSSFDFPTVQAVQSRFAGFGDAFVTKIDATGSQIIYSTFLGGRAFDGGTGIAVDSGGNAYVVGGTNSVDFPTVNPLQPHLNGREFDFNADLFLAKLSPTGGLIYSTYFGGSGHDSSAFAAGGGDTPGAIAVDAAGSVYLAGFTESRDFPVKNALQATPASGWPDAFVAKINPEGSELVYSTYLGGVSEDGAAGIAIDADGNAYVVGTTQSSDFPTKNPLQVWSGAGIYVFLTKLNATGSALAYSTYFFGNHSDFGRGVAVDKYGSAYITGMTNSTLFPIVDPIQPQSGGQIDLFVTKFTPDGTDLIYSTFLGGTSRDRANSIALDRAGSAYVTGNTCGGQFPVMNAIQPTQGGAQNCLQVSSGDAFVAKITDVIEVIIDIKPGSFPNSINLGSKGNVPVAIFSRADFDASTVDPLSVTLASASVRLKGNGSALFSLEDVNGDGLFDLLIHIDTQALTLTQTDTQAVLEGKTYQGVRIRGMDFVRIVPPEDLKPVVIPETSDLVEAPSRPRRFDGLVKASNPPEFDREVLTEDGVLQ